MDFNEYQRLAATTDVGTAAQDCLNPGFLYYVMGISGEAGEISEKFKKLFRDKNGIVDEEFKKVIIKEMGDVQWYQARLADWFGIEFEEIFTANVEKLHRRKELNLIHGDGDDR